MGYPVLNGDEPCREVDPDLFYQEAYDREMLRLLRGLCGGCNVRDACLEYALTEDFGFWAGYTAQERAKIARRRRRFSRAQAIGAALPQDGWSVR